MPSAVDLYLSDSTFLVTHESIVREQALANLANMQTGVHKLLHEMSPLQEFLSWCLRSYIDLELFEQMFEETKVPMQECLLASIFDERHLECFDPVSKLIHDIVEETELPFRVSAESLGLQKAQMLEALFEKQVMEESTCLSHHSFRIVCQFTSSLEQDLVDELTVIEEVVGVWESR